MSGGRMDWWNEGTTEDKLLASLIRLTGKLGHLPTDEEAKETGCYGQYAMYFGSFAGATKEVARLLYGHETLVSPGELLPEEQKLSSDQRQVILAERWKRYQTALAELSEPEGFVRRRREQKQARIRRRSGDTTGYVVQKIPVRSPRELREERERTSGLFEKKPAARKSEPEKKQTQKVGDWWRKSEYNPENWSGEKKREMAGAEERARESIRNAATKRRMGERDGKRNRDKVGGSNTDRMRAIEALWSVYRACKEVPTTKQVKLYAQEHGASKFPDVEMITRLLGNPDTWEEQLRDYAGARGLRFELVVEPLSGQDNQGGIDEMGRGPNVKKEEVLEVLWCFYREYRKFPSWAELAEYREAHPEIRVPNQRAFWKFLGTKETWEEQLMAYARENNLLAELAPEIEAPSEGLSVGSDGMDEEPEAADDAVSLLGADTHVRRLTPEQVAEAVEVVQAARDGSPEPEPGKLPADNVSTDVPKEELPSVDELSEPKPEADEPLMPPLTDESGDKGKAPVKLHLNLTGLVLKFQLDGREYELELGFGG